ncbi:pyrimidine reductase family protein [Candidatus Frankia alpina]|uniref:Pyrimidine reductase family protein n=1 Tax=Candidatus Frankia alpina TaxID=2699483 RepID=A0A4S5ESA7_9ACTN|nr:pyrimidine reductase family protein [Candidatus Frankia alpina]THJ74992.1 pyrimidine reductase family protein [Candidatus Frankia alpina]
MRRILPVPGYSDRPGTPAPLATPGAGGAIAAAADDPTVGGEVVAKAAEVDLDEAYAYPPGAGQTSYVRANFVSSVDGAAEVGGRSGPLGGDADRRVFQLLRWLSDVVLVGAGTVRHENYGPVIVTPERRDRRRAAGLAAVPPIAVVTATAGLDPGARLFDAEVRPVVLTCDAAPSAKRQALAAVAEVVICGDSTVDPASALAALAERGMTRVLAEGGPLLHAQLAGAGLLDELCLTVAPLLAGPGRMGIVEGPPWPEPTTMRLVQALIEDGNLFLRYLRYLRGPRDS